MTRIYYKEAVGAIITYDINRPASLDSVLKWKNDLDSKVLLADGRTVPCLLIGTKCDLANDSQSCDIEALDKFCEENNFIGWFMTSAKENVNIEQSVNFLICKILQNDRLNEITINKSSDVLRLHTYQDEAHSNKSKCLCFR
ncbi:ras-related protein Rab-32-like isoform X3 [Leptotrombidium deliense]|uniref:Ras-related protein Rab-32-like isoform X3 n=1 Tax=Leptotrombidium deliense TaxID=299467 RepID=A0A443SH53_9ACAR|nr:ras-related protein Rab-32-like isoform X3 [Leptotrombidium deliense]